MDAEQLRQLTIAQISAGLRQQTNTGRTMLALLEQDPRSGVRRLAVRERQRIRQRQAEARRQRRLRQHEEALWATQVSYVAGVDEVGRGCIAGPVVAAAVILAPQTRLPGVDDSKVLDASQRRELRQMIEAQALSWSVAVVSAERIDRINILEASLEAMRIALDGLQPSPEHVLVDGNRSPTSGYPETCLVGGDSCSVSIAAASIVAKQHRDELMVRLDGAFPEYGFARNKGYPSEHHRRALARVGTCPEHRRSFSPVSALYEPPVNLTCRAPGGNSTGVEGERLAAQFLRRQGYRIADRRYRGAGGEIDIVARDGECWVFVEVKTSATLANDGPEARIRTAQRRRILRAASHFLRFRGGNGDSRFDVVSVDLSTRPVAIEHWRDAFEASGSVSGSV